MGDKEALKLISIQASAVRDKVDYYIYMLASEPKGGDGWGQKNRYLDLNRLRLAQALAALERSDPALFKQRSISSLLELINQLHSTNQKIDQLLYKLPEEVRNAIFGQIYHLAPEPKGGDRWGELHRFDDPTRFRLGVIEVIKKRAV